MPPATLTDAQRSVWLRTVNSKPSEWFGPEHVPLLTSYCRHVVQADLLAEEVEKFDPKWLKDETGLRRYDRLLAMLTRETGRVNEFARAMRLTHQAIYRANKAATLERKGRAAKPWEVVEEE